MRKYVFGTGILSALLAGYNLLKEARGDRPFTWRFALAFATWGITLAMAIGEIVDVRRVEQGLPVEEPSKHTEKQLKRLRKRSEA